MAYPFPQDIQQRVQAQLASGNFSSEDDVLREAIATLESRQLGLRRIRQMVQNADDEITAGRVGSFDADETKQAVRERLKREGAVGPGFKDVGTRHGRA